MKDQKGFVLLDAIVGIMILCIGVTCIVSSAGGARQAAYLSQWKAKAANAAVAELEELEVKSISELITLGSITPGGVVNKTRDDINLQLESDWVSAGLLRVKITATWLFGPGKGQVVYETLLNRG